MIVTVTLNPAIDKVYFVDKLNLGDVNRPYAHTCSAGGKGLNVARVAHILGAKATALGFIGGRNGDYIKSEIKKQGIACHFTVVNGETRINTNISDKEGNSTEILEAGPTITVDEANRFIADFISITKEADIIAISGSMPKGIEKNFYYTLTTLIKDKQVIIDASGETLSEAIKAKPFMVKPNRTELVQLLGFEPTDNSSLKNALIFLYEKGIALPFITLGKDGAAAYVDGEFLRFIPPSVTVKNAVGSGDSTVGGICTGLDMGLNFIDAIRLGMASGCANTQFNETGFVSKELVKKYYNETIIDAF